MTEIYDLPNGGKIEMRCANENDVNGWEGKLCTPDDPEGEVIRVVGCGNLEALGALTKLYCRWLKKPKAKK